MPVSIAPQKLAELRLLGGDALVSQLLAKFLESSSSLIAQAEVALQSGDAAKVDFCVHTLKGSAMSLGLTEMSDLLVALNTRTKARQLEGMAADFTQLAVLLEAVRQYKAQNFP
ncbi:MAG TPA: Hpt domain-containing protein [Turneriella sp.]|nr:Hpt domain-containing protein [Turneriella sp.]HMY11823.1 Hpt domain-containing protein [Turneriella sp.]HNA77927.1 Hpt domain-containing protein [Turneriella sp.]HNE21234.1 Hpt domain-containing protein [Turneriella sp.]HNL11052.1 Hpt domain-containing protein [Turneriella sp.]